MVLPPADTGPDPEGLAERLAILLDHVEALRGSPYTYPEIKKYLQGKGISLSRARWGYMLAGDQWRVRDEALLTGLADLFEVSVGYFYGTEPLPPQIEAELDLVAAMRRAQVLNFAARKLGPMDAETLRSITRYLDGREH